MGILTVILVQCTNLPNADLLSYSDPYVRFELYQDNWSKDVDYGFQMSSVIKDNLNPVWNDESITFRIPTLENMVFRCRILDEDFGFSEDDPLGWCKIKLDDLQLTDNRETPVEVERVVDRRFMAEDGTIKLKLWYTEKDYISEELTRESSTSSATAPAPPIDQSRGIKAPEVTDEIEC